MSYFWCSLQTAVLSSAGNLLVGNKLLHIVMIKVSRHPRTRATFQHGASTARGSPSSDRQHLSYDGSLEVRGEIIKTVLCCIVY